MTGPEEDSYVDDDAAELDLEWDDPDEDVYDNEEPPVDVYTGLCVGGPYDGQTETSRFPSGFLLADRPGNHAWLYDWVPTAGTFTCRAVEPLDLSEEGRLRAAEESTYDVLAYDVERVTR